MTKKRQNHNASDIKFYYNVSQYKKIEEVLMNDSLDFTDFHLLLALYGLKNGNRIKLDMKDGKGEEHTFSRVVYQRASVQSDSNFGLITILDNLDQDYNEVMNNLAFQKMYNNDINYSKLPNVSTFYEYLIGGIEHLYNTIFEIGFTEEDIALALYDKLTEEEELTDALLELLLEEEKTEWNEEQ